MCVGFAKFAPTNSRPLTLAACDSRKLRLSAVVALKQQRKQQREQEQQQVVSSSEDEQEFVPTKDFSNKRAPAASARATLKSAAPPSSCKRSRSNRTFKRTRFQMDEVLSEAPNNTSCCDTMIPGPCHCDVSPEELWWSPDELLNIRTRNREAARALRLRSSSPSVEGANRNSNQNESTIDAARVFLCAHSQAGFTPTPVAYLSTVHLDFGDARGLEHGFMPTLRSSRKAHHNLVLKSYEHLRSLSQAHYERPRSNALTEEYQLRLAQRSVESSRAARIMAALVAREDARQVQGVSASSSSQS